jgi:hypothetical protein
MILAPLAPIPPNGGNLQTPPYFPEGWRPFAELEDDERGFLFPKRTPEPGARDYLFGSMCLCGLRQP